MMIHHKHFIRRITYAGTICCTLLTNSPLVFAWGAEGHTAIGVLATTQLQGEARNELTEFMGPLDVKAMQKACNWPDVIRETEHGASTGRRHYLNIPRGVSEYQQSRDCPDGQCATETVKHFAARLADRSLDKEQRWQAFAWLCHVVGDLHQPLHAGFGDDRGGNDVDVMVRGQQMNLHEFWDHELIEHHAGDRMLLVGMLGLTRPVPESSDWSAEMVDQWTNKSHEIARYKAYPQSAEIDEPFERQSWTIAQQRLSLAASRLAWIINTMLQNGDKG